MLEGSSLTFLLVDMSPKTRAHENAVAWLTRYIVLAVTCGFTRSGSCAPRTIGNCIAKATCTSVELDESPAWCTGCRLNGWIVV
jgi:hypothetical protein